jgi:hypothetical protein
VVKLNSSHFTWSRWRAGSPADFAVSCRTDDLVKIRDRLKAHAVGYCHAEGLLCRPKIDHKAVMFWKDGHHFWFHLRNKEFSLIFGEGKNE